jgi:ankyrin repeat protein
MNIFDAIEDDSDIDAVLEILKHDRKQVRARNALNDNPLHCAASADHARIVQILLDHGASVNAHGDRGWTPLHYAAYHGSLESIKMLVKAGADLEAKDDFGRTPLLSERDEDAARLLLRLGAAVDPETAVRQGRNGILAKYLKDPRVPRKGPHIANLLMIALGRPDMRAARTLLKRGADPNEGVGGRLPLIAVVSSSNGNIEAVRLLIEYGADVNIEQRTEDPELPLLTPMIQAMQVGFMQAIEVLRQAGAKEPAFPIPDAFHLWSALPLMQNWPSRKPRRNAAPVARVTRRKKRKN